MRLAWPMASLIAGATAFAAYAVPSVLVESGVAKLGIAALAARAVPFDGETRVMAAVLAASIAGAAVWMLFDRLERPLRAKHADADPVIDLFAPETAQLRKSDSHSGTPVRRPLFAASDLGTPMDDVERGPTPFGRPPLFSDDGPSAAFPAAGMPLHDANGDAPRIVPQGDVQAGAPEMKPDESIADRMARLERGIARRSGAGGAVSRPDPEQGLRDALAALRATTTRH